MTEIQITPKYKRKKVWISDKNIQNLNLICLKSECTKLDCFRYKKKTVYSECLKPKRSVTKSEHKPVQISARLDFEHLGHKQNVQILDSV